MASTFEVVLMSNMSNVHKRKQINSRTIIHFYIHLYDQNENHRQCDGGKDLPIDGLPRVVILECPTVRPFSQIHWSWTQTRTNKKVKCGPKGGGERIITRRSSIPWICLEKGSRTTLPLPGRSSPPASSPDASR